MHKLLQRQLERCAGPDGQLDTEALFALVSTAYEQSERDRRRTDRSIGLMVEELDELNRNLEAQVDHRTLALRQREAELERQNIRFDAALNNMSQSLVMYDRDARLVVFNRRTIEMFGFLAGDLKPGMHISEVLAARSRRGTLNGDPHELAESILARVSAGQTYRSTQELPDGRAVALLVSPTREGGWVTTHEDVTERVAAERKIAHMARHDALTGLPNRVLLLDRLDEAISAASEESRVALLFIDLDNFKAINDTLGHQSGDELLIGVSRRLRQCTRDSDIVARLGGDEFVIVQRGVACRDETEQLALRVGGIAREPLQINGHAISSELSIGIAFAPSDGTDASMLLKNADIALYRAKADGRGLHRFLETGMGTRLKARRDVELSLRTALEHGEFELNYQPIVSIEDGTVSAFEALLRWNRPGRGRIGPAEFVPLAEEIGLIVPIGGWVLQTACRAAARWPGHVNVAVNLSPIQLRQPGFVNAVSAALQEAGLEPHRLHLEITESVLLENNDITLQALHALRRLGVWICMDDFGTGYSSLSYLRSFPFDKIKIDRSFIHNADSGDEAVAILSAMAGLAKTLRITTIAEGVETDAQRTLVTSLGCTEIQGFIYSPGLPEDGVDDWLRRRTGRLAIAS